VPGAQNTLATFIDLKAYFNIMMGIADKRTECVRENLAIDGGRRSWRWLDDAAMTVNLVTALS
jgi:hypothetical protein